MEPASPSLSFTFIKPDATPEDVALGLATAKANHKAYVITSLAIYQKIRKVEQHASWKFAPIVGYPDGTLEASLKKDEAAAGFRFGAAGLVYVMNPQNLEDKDLIKKELEDILSILPNDTTPVYLYFPYAVTISEKSNLKVVTTPYPNVKIAFQAAVEPGAPIVNASLGEPNGANALPATVDSQGEVVTVNQTPKEKKKHHVLTRIAGVIWTIFIGWWLGIVYFLFGAFYCCTLIFIPVGIQMFKVGKLAFTPFGKSVQYNKTNGGKIFLNILWDIFGGGFAHTIGCFIFGGILFVFIITIPCGRQMFKFGKLMFQPLGAVIVNDLKQSQSPAK
jgi:uncharacterized membrane protein YccF (DUF307 family)